MGIVSGVGPLAGSNVLTKIFKNAAKVYGAVEDCEYPNLVLINHGIDGVDNSGALNVKFKTEITKMVKNLEDQDCNIIGIACNTAHIYLDQIKVRPETKLINLIDSVSEVAASSNKKILLLSSATTKRQKLYEKYLIKHKVCFSITDDAQQKLIDKAIGLVMAHRLYQAGAEIEKVFLVAKNAGFKTVIAGCTELPIAISYCKNLHGMNIIDSNDVLAKAMLAEYFGWQ